MRILILNPEYPPIGGGASNASAHVAKHLVALGAEVTLLTARFSDLPHEEVQAGVRIIRAPALRKARDRSGALEQISFVFGGLWSALNLMRSWKPDAILAFFGVPSGMIARPLRFFFAIPYIVSLRGGDVPGFRPYDFATYHKLIGPVVHLIWRQAAAVVANSEGLRQLGAAFDNKVPIQIIPNGVDGKQYPQRNGDWQPPRLMAVGRVVYQKGIDLTLQALSQLQDLDWRYTVIGDGSELPILEAMAADLGIAERVDFAGWRGKSDLPVCYQDANLYVYPSRHEGMPNVVLEAMASGLPVVASRIAGNEELVIPDETGLLVPPDDVDALTDALRQLIPDAQRRQQMGQAARQRVEEHYTWRSVAEQYLELLEKAVEVN
ncbi:MAG: glycosyltransferase family 1 protein [Chloroflexi bacterium]|nr:MAG: glycosyltransferase family 1 protein [Chloroflexota bacterium]MBL1193206.1 glycosyltransferase family 1 protein [Chloroflexota bacterium]NOH10500.1 glycosyltransferase family 4 protein [Chloroflexota bacterium]